MDETGTKLREIMNCISTTSPHQHFQFICVRFTKNSTLTLCQWKNYFTSQNHLMYTDVENRNFSHSKYFRVILIKKFHQEFDIFIFEMEEFEMFLQLLLSSSLRRCTQLTNYLHFQTSSSMCSHTWKCRMKFFSTPVECP